MWGGGEGKGMCFGVERSGGGRSIVCWRGEGGAGCGGGGGGSACVLG